MKEKENAKKTNFWLWIIIAIILVLIIFIGLWLLNRYWHELPSTAAEFGDSFGMANTIFSALAFAFLIVTALMQRKELELQRKELSETKQELKKSAAAQEASQKALSSQVSILSKQALLTSYQSMFNANSELAVIPAVHKTAKSDALKKAKEYYGKMALIVKEIEEEKKYYHDPFAEDKKVNMYKEFMKNTEK